MASLSAEVDPCWILREHWSSTGGLDAKVLLMYGSKTDPMFIDCAEALHAVLPHSIARQLPGLNHESAQTYEPETIAAALRLFFADGGSVRATHRA